MYSLLKDGPFSMLHDKKGYKFFCYSNIFPIGNNKEGSKKNLIISSPNDKLIDSIIEKLEGINQANIAEMSFSIASIRKVKTYATHRLVAATPIILRIPSYNYPAYGINSDYGYVYWRAEHSFDAFLSQLNGNLIKKYNEFNNTKTDELPLFEQFLYKKPVVSHVIVEGKEQKIIGSLWEFGFSHLSSEQRRIIEFGMDVGFGERNSLGFGFINAISDSTSIREKVPS